MSDGAALATARTAVEGATLTDHPRELAVAALVVGLGIAGGPVGVAIGLVVAAVFALGSALYAYAVGQLLVAVALEPTGVTWILAQAALAALFVGILLESWPTETVRTAIVGFAIAVPALAATALLEPMWLAAGALGVSLGAALYGIYRYELVALGQVPGGVE